MNGLVIYEVPNPVTPEQVINDHFLPNRIRKAESDQLYICFHCKGEMVYPLDWSEEGPRHWWIVLRCPECEARREGVFEQDAVERLDDELELGSSQLLGDSKRVTAANMCEEIKFFVRALYADLVIPDDF